MRKYDVLFLDRDGTINPDPGYISSLNDYKLYPFMDEVILKFAENGEQVAVVTNQSGVDRGIIKESDLRQIHDFLETRFTGGGVDFLGVYFCPDHPEAASDRRKPGKGMFLEVARDHAIDLTRSIIIGDGLTDMEAGFNLGIDTMLVLTGQGRRTKKELVARETFPTYITRNILTGIKYLQNE